MSEVGALIVRLQAETAQFRSDLGKVKQDLQDLKSGAEQAGDGIDYSMAKARGSMMLMEAATGVRLPRALNSLIASIPAVGAAFAMMLPLVGVVAAIAVIGKLVQAHEKLKDEAFQTEVAQRSLGATVGTVMSGLGDKLLQAGIKADELNGDHLAALHKTLLLIDHQSLSELAQQFDALAKAAEASFATLQTHWYQFGGNADGAKRSLADFQSQYELLLRTGKSDEANKLLDEKIQREQQVLALQKQASDTTVEGFARAVEARKQLHSMEADFTKQDIEGEKDLLNILYAQREAHATIAKTASVEKGVAVSKDNLKSLADEAAVSKIAAAGVEAHSQALIKMAAAQEKAKTAPAKASAGNNDDAAIDAALQQQKAAIEEEKEASISSAAVVLQAKKTVYDADIKAAGANAQKKKELDQQWANEAQAYSDAVLVSQTEANAKSVQAEAAAVEEKRKLAEALAQSKATLDRANAEVSLSTAMAAIKKEQDAEEHSSALGLVSERKTLAAKLKIVEQERDAKITALNAEIAAEQAAANKSGQNGDRAKQNQDLAKAAQLQAQLNNVTAEYASQVSKVNTDLTKLNSSWASYFGKMKVETQDLATQVKTKLQASVTQFTTAFGNSMAQCIVEHKSLGQAVRKEAGQMAEEMISMLVQWLEKWIITHTMAAVVGSASNKAAQTSAAALAGANMTASYAAAPFPIDMGAPAAGAAAMAAAMSFEVDGKIPGSGPVPITGHGGETVVTKALTDRVESSERGGSNRGGGDMHVHFAPQIHAMDAEGVDRVLTKHSSTFERHFRSAIRRMNK